MAATKRVPTFVPRVSENLEAEPLANLLRLTAVVVENAREFFERLDDSGHIDSVLKPFVRELVRRAFEMDAGNTTARPRARGNA